MAQQRLQWLCAACAILPLLGGCLAYYIDPATGERTEHPIPIGTYSDRCGDEVILVGDRQIHLHVTVNDDNADEYHREYTLDRSYPYSVWRDGELSFGAMATGEYLAGVGRYRWYWDGQTIARVNWRNWTTTRFTKSACSERKEAVNDESMHPSHD
jgi:hypothetical protein